MTSLKSRKGMAIVLALAFCFVLMILIVGMWTSQSSVARQNRTSLQSQQAYFAARAAIQHLLLKARLMPTEFYDGLAFTVGKNPNFSFTEYTEPVSSCTFEIVKSREGGNPVNYEPKVYGLYWKSGTARAGLPYEIDEKNNAPRFVYGKIDGSNPATYFRLGTCFNSMYRFLRSDIVASTNKYREADVTKLKTLVTNAERTKYLDYFIGDCNNLYAPPATLTPQLLLKMKKRDKARPKDWSIVALPPGANGYLYSIPARSAFADNVFPYSLEYRVASASMAAMKEVKKYGEEAIIIEVEGKITDFQGQVFTTKQTRTQKITRTGYLPQ